MGSVVGLGVVASVVSVAMVTIVVDVDTIVVTVDDDGNTSEEVEEEAVKSNQHAHCITS